MEINYIPKIIHYCWFGRGPLPSLAIKCINSWKRYLPEYLIMEWNEDNFPFDQYIFAKEALENKKFAFVSDVCRLHALKEFGGVYMDTDVEVIKPLDNFLHHIAFSGFENDDFVPTGIMASQKDGAWVSELLKYYDCRSFINPDGTLATTTNTFIITNIMKQKGVVMNNTYQDVDGYVTFYPNDFFCPKSYKTGEIVITTNTYCIHHFNKSWLPRKVRIKNKLKMKLMNVFGYNKVQFFINLLKK